MPQPNPKALKAVRHSKLALGIPYVWGGVNYDSGVDCSGLIYVAYRAAGVLLPRTSQKMYQDPTFRPVTIATILPGDLVFSEKDGIGLPGHVVMSVGGGKVIAARYTGTRVQLQNIADLSYFAIKRPLPAVGEGPYIGGNVIGQTTTTETGNGKGTSVEKEQSTLHRLEGGFSALTDPHTWYRVGQVLLGAVTIMLGLVILNRSTVLTVATRGAM